MADKRRLSKPCSHVILSNLLCEEAKEKEEEDGVYEAIPGDKRLVKQILTERYDKHLL